MTTFRKALAWFVGVSGFFCWFVFWPQIQLLIEKRSSETTSLISL